MTERFKHPVCQRANIGGKSNAQQIEGIDRSFGMSQAQEIDAALPSTQQSFDRVLCGIPA